MFLPPSNKQVRLLHVADDWSYLLLWYDPTDRHKPAYLWNAIRSHLLFDVSMLKMDFVWQVSISNSFKFSQNDNFNILIVLETLRSPMKASPLVSGQPLDESRKRESNLHNSRMLLCSVPRTPSPAPTIFEGITPILSQTWARARDRKRKQVELDWWRNENRQPATSRERKLCMKLFCAGAGEN